MISMNFKNLLKIDSKLLILFNNLSWKCSLISFFSFSFSILRQSFGDPRLRNSLVLMKNEQKKGTVNSMQAGITSSYLLSLSFKLSRRSLWKPGDYY